MVFLLFISKDICLIDEATIGHQGFCPMVPFNCKEKNSTSKDAGFFSIILLLQKRQACAWKVSRFLIDPADTRCYKKGESPSAGYEPTDSVFIPEGGMAL
jgi:hypothetical protein